MIRPLRLLLAVIAAFGLLALGLSPASAASGPAATSGSVAAPVTGTGTSAATGAVGTFAGTATITRFINQNGVLTAVGTVSGTLTDAAGNTIGTLTNAPFQAPVTSASGTCQILTLHIGAIHLDLLGLVVDLAPVDLNITAQSGSGNLLGNLLCAVAHLLDSNASTGALANLLNHILSAL